MVYLPLLTITQRIGASTGAGAQRIGAHPLGIGKLAPVGIYNQDNLSQFATVTY